MDAPASAPRDPSLTLIRSAADNEDAAVEAMNVLRQLVRALRAADSESEGTLGVTAAQLFVLRVIQSAGSLSVSELAQHTATAQSSVSEVVARLAARDHAAALGGRSAPDGDFVVGRRQRFA
jgi:hypothetical protein